MNPPRINRNHSRRANSALHTVNKPTVLGAGPLVLRSVATLAAVALLATPVLAIPTNPDPLHTAAATPWSSVAIGVLNPATDQHQHYNTDNLFGVAGKFKTYSVWDNNVYRYNAVTDLPLSKAVDGQDYGHGYMQLPATYKYDVTVPALARPLFNTEVVDYWQGAINGPGVNTNGVPINTLINFAEVPDPLVSDIVIRFAMQYPTGPAGGIMLEDFPSPGEIEPDGNWPGNPNPGGGRDGVLAFWTPSLKQMTFNSAINWFYDAPGLIPQAGQFDFITTALHEFGHALGLDHEGVMGDVMFGRQAPYKLDPNDPMMMNGIPFDATTEVRALDAGSKDGSTALYTIATPEPASLALLLVGVGFVAACSRRSLGW